MPFRFSSTMRYAVLLLMLGATLVLPACDSDDDDSGDLGEVDDLYSATQMRFQARNIDNVGVNLLNGLENAPTLDIVGGAEEFTLSYNLARDDEGRLRLRGQVTRRGDVLRFDVEDGNAEDLLLPTGGGVDFQMQVRDGGGVLVGGRDGSGISLEEVNLEEYGVDQTLNGSLQVRFERQ